MEVAFGVVRRGRLIGHAHRVEGGAGRRWRRPLRLVDGSERRRRRHRRRRVRTEAARALIRGINLIKFIQISLLSNNLNILESIRIGIKM